jgi:hypothetical protein
MRNDTRSTKYQKLFWVCDTVWEVKELQAEVTAAVVLNAQG